MVATSFYTLILHLNGKAHHLTHPALAKRSLAFPKLERIFPMTTVEIPKLAESVHTSVAEMFNACYDSVKFLKYGVMPFVYEPNVHFSCVEYIAFSKEHLTRVTKRA